MIYYFDDFGWLSLTPIEGRSTTVAPPDDKLADGWVWNRVYGNGEANDWVAMERNPVALVIEPSPDLDRSIALVDLMSRFTDNELKAIYTAAKASVEVEIWVDKLRATPRPHRDDPRLVDGLNSLVAAKLLAEGRPAEILK